MGLTNRGGKAAPESRLAGANSEGREDPDAQSRRRPTGPPQLLKDDNQLHGAFEKVRDHVAGACHYCAGAFGVRDQLEQQKFPLLRDHKGHPSLRGLVADGYEVITF